VPLAHLGSGACGNIRPEPVIQGGRKCAVFVPPNQTMDRRTLLPALESPLSEFVPEVASAREVVMSGLDWPTPYWPELAVTWLEDGLPMDDEIARMLSRIAGTKTFPQKLRHRSAALVRQWTRR
jgi:hypothetical protein